MKPQYLSIFVFLILAIGCHKQPEVFDPCADAPRTCWGQAGQNMTDNPYCQKLTACFDWEARAK